MNRKSAVQWSGWIAAAAVVGVFALSGFQGPTDKSGTVDLNRAIQQSDFGKSSTASLNAALAARRQLVDFVATNRVLTSEQAIDLRALMLKANQTDADKKKIQDIQDAVKTSDTKFKELSQKANMTDTERQLLTDFTSRAQTMLQTLDRWNAEFNEELGQMQEQARTATIDRAKAALGEVAKGQGYTVVFEATYAPYGANDLTDAVIKAMNAKK
jgi:Skp family chaperone for outer membrane proteins